MQSPPPQAAKYPLVQALRAAAALAVAYHHIFFAAHGRPDRTAAWDAGVDVFFVISGFVIATSSARLLPDPHRARIFLARRLARIVPLYWAATTLFLAILAASPDAIRGAIGGPAYLAASYLFFPATRPDGLVQPAFGLGWTLNYEMAFYLLFALALLVRLPRPALAVCAVLGLLVLLRQTGLLHTTPLLFWSDPIVLEFASGMALARISTRLALPAALRAALAAAVLALTQAHFNPDAPRVLSQGLPALALVAAATLGPSPLPRRAAFWLDLLGDASYALYLVHPFIMRAGQIAWLHAHRAGGPALYIAASLVAAQLCALAIRLYIERPVNAWLRQLA